MRQIANLLTGITRSGGSNPLPIAMAGWQSLVDCAGLENQKPGELGSGVRIPPPSFMVDIV